MKQKKYFFERKYRTYDELKDIFEHSKSLNRFKKTANLVDRKNNIILDVGCGAGYLSVLLDDKMKLYVGTDLLDSNITIAKLFYDKKNRIFTTEDIFLDNNAFVKKNYFDYVLLLELIGHVDNPGLYIKRVHELLKKGGHIIVSTPNAVSITNILWNIKNRNRIVTKYSVDGTETDHVMTWINKLFRIFLCAMDLR